MERDKITSKIDNIIELKKQKREIDFKLKESLRNISIRYSINADESTYDLMLVINGILGHSDIYDMSFNSEADEIMCHYLNDNIILCVNYFTHWSFRNNTKIIPSRKLAMDKMIEEMKAFKENLSNMNFSSVEKDYIFTNYGEKIYKSLTRSSKKLFSFCEMFPQYITEEMKDTMIKRLIGRKDIKTIQYLLSKRSVNIQLSADQIERLKASIMMSTLRG